jgi:hypothetical protein
MNKERAREFLIKSKLYRFLALVFACVGVLIFIFLCFRQEEADGNFLEALSDPVTITFIIFPFAPSLALTFMARRAERKLRESLKEQ